MQNPQPFTGYWAHPKGDVFTLKQWGNRLTGSIDGTVDGDAVTTGEGKVLKLSKDAETAVLDGVELKRRFPELIVMCGPSGVGKGTLLHKLFAEYPSLFGFSISHTTRAPRPGEENGKDYHFISHDSIKAMIDQGEFVEFAEVHGNYYGTSKASVKAVQDTGKLCVLDIDIQGAQKVAKAGIPFVGVFVKPPSREELEKRLRGRGTETEDKILKRLKNALGEIDFCDSHTFFTYELVNDNLDLCYKDLVHAISQSTRAPALPPMTHEANSTPACGVTPSAM